MSQITPVQVIRDHLALNRSQASQRPRKIGLALLTFGLAAGLGAAVWLFEVETNAISALLTATSIMTGLVFTMAMRFWERSLDARSDPDLLFDTDRKQIIDDMRTLLLWTVIAGIASTAYLAGVAITVGTGTANAWTTGVAAGLTAYQLMYVLRALISLYAASYTLRK